MTRFNVFFNVYCIGGVEWFWTCGDRTEGPFAGEAAATLDAALHAR